MSNTALIRDISSLEELRIAIARFCEESENQLNAIDSKLQSRIGNLKSLESQFQRIIELEQENLNRANNSLYLCESNTYEDEDGNTQYPDCDFERDDVIECRRRLYQAEHNYNMFRREISNLEKSINEYQAPKVKYKTLIQFEKEAATSSLKQLINGAEDYLSVSSPMGNSFTNGFGITETIAKMDPTLVIAATIGLAEIILMSVFTFIGVSGKLFKISNEHKNSLITSTYSENGSKHICSELKIEKRETSNYGKIVSVNIPSSLQNEKIGKYIINNMESTCRANDCNEISAWANSNNIEFYKNLGYQSRNEIKDSGTEVFKPLENGFLISQQNAKTSFAKLTTSDFIKSKNIGKQQINPLNILSPDEINEEKFWQQHGENQSRYIDLIEKYDKCNQLLKNGKTIDDIRKEDSWVANAYDVFNSSEPVRLQKSGDYYRIEGSGRHRVAAAQIYYIQTGKIVPIVAEVFEKN